MTEITAVSRSVLSDQVFAQLIDQILAGRLAPDELLPPERELAEVFEVNRHAIREALKRLQQTGLVRIAQGGKTRVMDWRRHAGLELLVEIAQSGAVPTISVLRDIAVLRQSIGAGAARLCAEQASAEALTLVVDAAGGYPADPSDHEALAAADLAFWDAVIDGSGNLAYRLALNTVVTGIDRIGLARIAGLVDEYADRGRHTALAQAIAERDGARAQSEAHEMLGLIVTAIDGIR
ncbi:FadR/GntR family transcriptional regulator [Rhodococcus sp. NPDC055112]